MKPKKASYHHGDAREALLQAAERVLCRDGVEKLTLREVAREAGVSHAAPKNHFGNLSGLLSDLAAIGFERFRDEMVARIAENGGPAARLKATGIGYVAFAHANRELFLLMFRSERLDYSRPGLRHAAEAAFAELSGGVSEERGEVLADDGLTLEQAAGVTRSWALVHGFAMLLLDGRLQHVLDKSPDGTDALGLLQAIMCGPGSGSDEC